MVATLPPQSREISPELYAAIKLACRERPEYKLAREVGFEPSAFSRILRDRVRPVDESRVLELAALVGVPPDRVWRRAARRRGER